MSHESDDAVIAVRRQWNDRRIATYRLRDISELQWGRTSGGTRARTPQLFVHGYVMCDAMIGGKLAHSCSHGPAPHRIKVCLTRKENESVWKHVVAIVGQRPGRPLRPGGRTISSPMSLHYTPAARPRDLLADGNDGKGRATSHEGEDAIIEVRQQWNDWRIATYRLGDISELRWGWRGGGLKWRTPQPFVHGYVMCNGMIGGELAHSCPHGAAPHRLKVCLTKKGNESVWKDVAAIVGPRPDRTRRRAAA
jgi:hypothetical protein